MNYICILYIEILYLHGSAGESDRVFQEKKVNQIFRNKIFQILTFVFLKHPFLNSPFCLITDVF